MEQSLVQESLDSMANLAVSSLHHSQKKTILAWMTINYRIAFRKQIVMSEVKIPLSALCLGL